MASGNDVVVVFEEDDEYRKWLGACRAADEDFDVDDDAASSGSGEAPMVTEAVADLGDGRGGYSWDGFGLKDLEDIDDGAPGRVMTLWGIADPRAPGATAPLLRFPDVVAPAVPFGISRLPASSLVVWSERALVLELVRVLQGRTSQCVETLSGGDGVRLSPNVAVDGLSPQALRGLVSQVIIAASQARRIAHTLAILQQKCPTPFATTHTPGVAGVAPLVPALTDAVTCLTRACAAYWTEVEARWQAEPEVPSRPALASLPRLRRALRASGAAGWLTQCEQVVLCAQSLEDDCYGATVLLSRLSRWGERARQGGGAEEGRATPSVAVSILLRCLEPYLAEVGGWAGSGKLAAPAAQEPMLFIADTSRRNAGPYADWEARWRIVAAKVPCFIPQDVAKLVAVTGLSVRFLLALRSKLISASGAAGHGVPPLDLHKAFLERFYLRGPQGDAARPPALCGEAAGLSDVAMQRVSKVTAHLPSVYVGHQPCALVLPTALGASLRAYSERIGAVLVASMREHCEMERYLDLLKGVFLLQKGVVMQYFCAKHLFPLARRSDWNNKPSSEEMKTLFLESWLVDKSTTREQLAFLEGVTVRWADPGEDVASLRFSPDDDTPRVPLDREPPLCPLRIVTGLVVECLPASANSPMHIVFPHEVVVAYARVLQVLLLVAYAQDVLVRMRLPKMPWKATQLEIQIIATRLHLLHFIQALKDHLLTKAQAIWAEGIARLERARDIEAIRACHKRLAHLLLAAVNFTCRHREHWTTLLSIVTLTLKFESAIAPYVAWLRDVSVQFSVKGVRASDPNISHASFPAPAEVHAAAKTLPSALRAIMAQFRRHMQFFVATLRSHGGTSTGNAVLARFDFSGIYSR